MGKVQDLTITLGSPPPPSISTATHERNIEVPHSNRRPTVFQPNHALKFGLEVVARDPNTNVVTSALCLFCKHFGREVKPGAKRRATTNFKFFKNVFRTDQYLQHHRLQHPTKWTEYESASIQEKVAFFPRHPILPIATPVVVANGTTSKSMSSNKKLKLDFTSTTIRDIFYEIPEGIVTLFTGKEGRWSLLSISSELFRIECNSDTMEFDGMGKYIIHIQDRLSFELTIELHTSGLTPSQITASFPAISRCRQLLLGPLVQVWEDAICCYIEIAGIVSLSLLSTLLSNSWAFSLSLHNASTEHAIEVRIQCAVSPYQSFHLCQVTSSSCVRLNSILDIIHPRWRVAILGIRVDGDIVDDKSLAIVRAIIHQVKCGDQIHVIWNEVALLQSALHALLTTVLNGSFVDTLDILTRYIESQSKLMQDIGHCQRLPNLLGEGAISTWLERVRWCTEKRVRICRHLEEQFDMHRVRPSNSWWITLSIVDWIMASILEHLHNLYSVKFPHTDERTIVVQKLLTHYNEAFESHGREINSADVRTFAVELGTFVSGLVAAESNATHVFEGLAVNLSSFLKVLQTGLAQAQKIIPKYAHKNRLILPSTPHDVAALRATSFSVLMEQISSQFNEYFTEEQRDAIDQEYHTLKRSNRDRRENVSESNVHSLGSAFEQSWCETQGQYSNLVEFIRGLATLTPLTYGARRTQQEWGDKSIRKQGMYMNAEMDIDIETPLYASQLHELGELVK